MNDAPEQPAGTAPPRRLSLWAILPLGLFVALAALLFVRLFAGDTHIVPSALVGKPAPAAALPALEGLSRDGKPLPGLTPADFAGAVTVVNVWASWCIPCHDEAPLLMRLAALPELRVAGINYKDTAENARRFLGRYGNPFAAIGVDPSGRASIEWGVYGVPETFVVGRDGRIAYKLIGPITEANFDAVLMREIAAAQRRGVSAK